MRSANPRDAKIFVLCSLVGAGGFEPPTSCVSGKRSNQLSYAPEKNNEHAARGDTPVLFFRQNFQTATKYQQFTRVSRTNSLPSLPSPAKKGCRKPAPI